MRDRRWLRLGRYSLLGRRFFAHALHNGRFFLASEKRQSQGRAHKQNGDDGRQFSQKRCRSSAAEHCLAGTAERGADTRALAMLQKHDAYESQTGEYVNNHH